MITRSEVEQAKKEAIDEKSEVDAREALSGSDI